MNLNSKLTIVVPCYNEVGAIPNFIAEALEFSNDFRIAFPEIILNILFVDNNSTDMSHATLNDMTQKYPDLFRLTRCSIQGYGAALKHGFSEAARDSQYLGFLDLDDTYPIKEFSSILKKTVNESFDIVYGVRLHKTSKIEFTRYFGNFLYVFLLRILTGSTLSDACSGMRIFKSGKVSEVCSLLRNDLAFSIEFTAHAVVNKWKIGEYPIPYRDRIGSSKLNIFYDGYTFLLTLLRTVAGSKNSK